MDDPLVSVIIPTKNSSRTLEACLKSIKDQSYKNIEVVINDDKRTTDDTEELIEKYSKDLNIHYIRENISMAQGRKAGAEFSKGEILLHLDSDMELSNQLVEECVDKISGEYDALVIPEESFGTTFWAKCKWLEKKCYEGVENIESLRAIKREVYFRVGGHDEKMVFSEDKDMDIRVRNAGYKVGRTKNILRHNEGNLKLFKTIKKKLHYSNTANLFAEKHPKEFAWQANPLNRYIIFFKNGGYLFKYPAVYIGMIFMKTCEFFSGGIGYLLNKDTKFHGAV